MTVPVDIWLRGDDFATTRAIEGVPREPKAWTDDDVRLVLTGMLQAMYRVKHPGDAVLPVALRGLSWIVSPFEGGGVVVAIEITMGAVIAGPLDIDQTALEVMIARVLGRSDSPATGTVH
jgi:hypothetical protein